MKFLCDQMLAGLGKWLRAAGYDTMMIDTAINDHEIYDLAVKFDRYLLTRDRDFLKEKYDKLIILKGNTIEECVQELTDRLHINWLYKPFSRCLVCNGSFTKPNIEQLSSKEHEQSKEYWYCSGCQKLFWQGSHTEHMLNQLKRWESRSI